MQADARALVRVVKLLFIARDIITTPALHYDVCVISDVIASK
jgi:hypothetical protein